MKLIRLTSVFLCCALLSSFLLLPASAADDDSYYSAPAVSDGLVSPASLGGVMLASATSWDTTDRSTLQGIYKFIQYLTTAPSSYNSGSVIGLLHQILNKSGSSGSVPNADTNFKLYRNGTGTNGLLFDIYTEIGNVLPYSYGTNVLSWLSTISSNVMKADTTGLATESTLSSFSRKIPDFTTGFFYPNSSVDDPVYDRSLVQFLNSAFSVTQNAASGSGGANSPYNYGVTWYDPDNNAFKSAQYSFSGILATQLLYLTRDGKDLANGYQWTLYHYVKQLSEVLASDDDKQLAESQKENREQIEQDFLSGKSGKTSLGKDDFGSLSSVGGTFKDTISLNGQSSLSDLSSGLSDADTVGQGWFSQVTKDSLDAVSDSSSSESTVSTFSDDGSSSVDVDPDPYHMQGFEDNYAWLWGDDDG